MKIEKDYITFTSGREVYVNRGIVGLSPELDMFGG